MTDQLPFGSKLAHNIGLIVLQSQELERHLKLVAVISDPSSETSVIDLHKRLERRSLGEVVKRILGNVTVQQGGLDDLESYFRQLLDRRNKVVHHFYETYREEFTSGNHAAILASLGALYEELRAVASSFETANHAFLECLQAEAPLESGSCFEA